MLRTLLATVVIVLSVAENDALAAKIYWADDLSNTIQRADLDGLNRETIGTGLDQPRGVAIDVVNDKVYWADTVLNRLERANLDGSNREVLVTGVLGQVFLFRSR